MKMIGVGTEETGTSAVILRFAQIAGTHDGHLRHRADEEHRRIARELHDNASQNLVAVLMHIASLQANGALDGATQAILTESARLIEQSSDQIRDVCYQLYPPCLDELGLTAALRRAGVNFERQTGVATKIDIASDLGRFSSEIEIALFRAVQEALADVQTHSESQRVCIHARRDQSGICVSVSGQQRGGAKYVKLRPASNGMATTQARVEDLGGTVTIKLNARRTQVVVHMPARQVSVAAV